MKPSLFFSAAFILLLLACDRTDPLPEPVVSAPLVQLSYDGSNVTAPLFPGGTYEGAVRFTPADLAGLSGKSLKEVIFYVLEEPRSATIRVYQGSASGGPGQQVFSQAVGNDIQPESWHRIALTSPVAIDASQDLWIGFRFEAGSENQVLGCDGGPADANGDFLFDSNDGLWQNLVLRTSFQIDINWNLRGVVE